jgi:uncharacterized protein (TIGR02147 family)
MNDQVAIQQLLQTQFAEHQSKNPRYSLRAFSKRVGVETGPLSAILNGKRRISRKLAERIVTRLMLDPQRRSEILRLFPDKRPYTKQSTPARDMVDPKYLELTAAHYRVVSEWQHFAIISLMDTKDFIFNAEWISERLGISRTLASESIERMLKVGMLTLSSDGSFKKESTFFRTTDDVANISLKKSHESTLELAKASLHRDSVQVRDITAVTMAIDPARIGMAKEFIRKFQDEFCVLVEQGNQTEVYKLSMQFFPLTQIRSVKT